MIHVFPKDHHHNIVGCFTETSTLPLSLSLPLYVKEKYYPLRPELAESTAMLYMATGEGRFQEAGKEIVDDLAKHTRWDQDPHPRAY